MTTRAPALIQRSRWLLACCLLAWVGCAQRDGVRRTPTRPLEPFSASGQVGTADRWWTEFRDPRLDRQVNLALGDNLDLAAALERLRAARALARREASDLFPDVNGVLGINSGFGPGRDRTVVDWGVDASYQVDLWGKIQSRADAERFRASATHADYHAVALTLSAEVARTWFSLIEAHAQIELLNQQLATNRTGQETLEGRFGRGFVNTPDVLRQRQLVESTLEQIVVVKARVEVLEHRLAVLQGQLPQSASYETGAQLPELPPLPDTGLPSELLMRRPDVLRDYFALMAADRDLAAAITDQYPRLNLTGAVLNVADKPETVFRDWFVSIGGQLIAPLLDGGQRRAEVDRTAAVVAQRFDEYGQTMLIAFGEVEDSLALERYQIQRIERLETQEFLAQQAAQQLREQYIRQGADYLDVLSANQAQQRLQRELLSARLELVSIRIGLYVALAGGFDTRPMEMSEEGFDRPVLLPPDPPEAPLGPEELPPPPEPAVELDFDE